MDKIKCITFDKNAQDALPAHIKAKMKADRDNAKLERLCQNACGLSYSYCEKAKHNECADLLNFKNTI